MTKKKTNLKDHTVPASIIGSFSDSKDDSPRERKVYYLHRKGMTSPPLQKGRDYWIREGRV